MLADPTAVVPADAPAQDIPDTEQQPSSKMPAVTLTPGALTPSRQELLSTTPTSASLGPPSQRTPPPGGSTANPQSSQRPASSRGPSRPSTADPARISKNSGSVSFYDRAAEARVSQKQLKPQLDPSLGSFLELDNDLITRAVESPETWLLRSGEVIFFLNALGTLVISLVFLTQELKKTTYNQLSKELKYRVLIIVSIALEFISALMWVGELWLQLHLKRKRVSNARMIGMTTVWRCMTTSTSTFVIIGCVVLRVGLSIASVWQPILLPVATALFCTPALFICMTGYSLGPVNAAASAVAFNNDGFLTPASAIEVEPSLMTTRATPMNGAIFVKFSDIREINMGYSSTRFSFLSSKNQSGEQKCLSRSHIDQRLFFLICTLKSTAEVSETPVQAEAGGKPSKTPVQAEAGGKPPHTSQNGQRMVGFLLAPQVASYCMRPQRIYGCGQETFRELIGSIARHAPQTEGAAGTLLEKLDQHADEFVIRRVYGAAFSCF